MCHHPDHHPLVQNREHWIESEDLVLLLSDLTCKIGGLVEDGLAFDFL